MAPSVMHVWLNWLWQATALLLVVGFVVRMRGRALNAATRERIWWMTLLAVLGIPILPLLTFVGEAPVGILRDASDLVKNQRLVVTVPHAVPVLAGALWAAWVVASTIQLVRGTLRLRSARRFVRPVGSDQEHRLKTWCQMRGQGRSATLVTSSLVHRAAVLGLGRPLIALAPEMLARLADDELDQVVVHEYAHVQRRDDIAILLQRAIVAVAGLHPAVWWLDRAITIEREVACDDWVLTHTRSAKRYATCLVGLASLGRQTVGPAPGAALSTSQVSIRVARMLDYGRNQTIARSRTTLLTARLAMVGLVVVAAALPIVEVSRSAEGSKESHSIGDELLGAPGFRPESVATNGTTPIGTREPLHAGTPPEPGGQEREIETLPILPVTTEAAVPTVNRRLALAPTDVGIAPERLPRRPRGPDVVLPAIPETTWSSMGLGSVGLATPVGEDRDAEPRSPWDVTWRPAVTAATAIGDGSRTAAVKTAGFFGNLGKSIAASF